MRTNRWHRLIETTEREAELIFRRAVALEPRLGSTGIGVLNASYKRAESVGRLHANGPNMIFKLAEGPANIEQWERERTRSHVRADDRLAAEQR